jgi:hypothetical protein
MPRFFNTPKSSPRPAQETRHPEDAVQSEHGLDSTHHFADRLGLAWLGEARWFYAKSLNFAFWGLASIWYLFVIPQNSSGIVMVLTGFAAAMFVMTINAGAALIEATDRQQYLADDAIRLCQELEQDLAWERLENVKSKPFWGSGEEDAADSVPSPDVLPWPNEERV